MRRHHLPPCEIEITGLGDKGLGRGEAPDGKPIFIRGAPPGSRVHVRPFKKKKGTWHARRLHMVRPPPGAVEPPCPLFGLCGGCVLQELPLAAQVQARQTMALEQVARTLPLDGVRLHPPRSTGRAYGYRNKVELSFGVGRYLSEADHAAGLPIAGRFLGFHAPGRFDRVVDADHCLLVDDPLNRALKAVRSVALDDGAPPPWDARAHTGFWRHLRLRHGTRTDQVLVGLYTASPTADEGEWVARVAEALRADPEVVGVVWLINDSVADVARGDVRQTWGVPWLEERLGQVTYRLSLDAFFQTNTAGAELLYDTIGEALGDGGGHLLDLYCGTGAIGLYLADRFDRITGIEEVESAVADARANAERNGVVGEWHQARVEAALDTLPEGARVVVDPPRAGLHPKVAKRLARTSGDTLVYVACNPASLGRDGAILAEGGWRLADVWTVDLFPQTGHVELVGRFVREA
ncbi:MAG: 23S rRNA (uracil1939-C5)-methyltransferase [Myxococcota bacterium]|jgi:23S rRNA (uracil1939-C5)-methyltransferase